MRTLRASVHAWKRVPGEDCVYCGEVAEVGDHVYPIAAANRMPALTDAHRAMLLIVPSCRSCNSIAADRIFDSFEAKATYIKERIAQQHRRTLAAPDWEARDLDELGPGLQAFVKSQQAMKRRVRDRLDYESSLAG